MDTTPINNTIYLRRRRKIVLPPFREGAEPTRLAYIASVTKNLEAVGYGFSPALLDGCKQLTIEQLAVLYAELAAGLLQAKGAHKTHQPMYPNFPAQVMQTSEAELYINALVHYWTAGQWLPYTEREKRVPIKDAPALQKIELGTQAEFDGLFALLAAANTVWGQQDKDDAAWFVQAYGDNIGSLLPIAIPQKENIATLAGLLVKHTTTPAAFVQKFAQTATDVLRIAVGLSGGDVSLATPAKFRTFSRPERVLFLGLLDAMPNATEDMLRWKNRWVRLGEKLHPSEYAGRFPRAAQSFAVLRNDVPFATFGGQVEKSLAEKQVEKAVQLLQTRPGDFARRLDHLLRLEATTQEAVAGAFAHVADKVSTPVLLQVMHHFSTRNGEGRPLAWRRVFFPKGNLAKAYGVMNTLPLLPPEICGRVSVACEDALTERFRALPPLGKCYIDPALDQFPVPFGLRSASKALRTLVRGSKLPLTEGDTLRFFVWWQNGKDTTDIDLSAALFDADFNYRDVLAYYNLKNYGGVHSGDIVDAPLGASEFIDVSLQKVREAGLRYIVMVLNSYTDQPFVSLPECFAGWMARTAPQSGEIFEPKTVQNKIDLTADTKIALPLVIDVAENNVVWCDMALRRHPKWHNNVETNKGGIQMTLQSLVDVNKPTLYELFLLHAQARGELVNAPEQADVVFSRENETPFRLETIAAEFMA